MKLLILLIVLLTAPISGFAQSMESKFGFTITLPDDWTVISAENVADKVSLSDLDRISNELKEIILPLIKSGKAEYIFPSTDNSEFASNINVIEQKGKIPSSKKQVQTICDQLPAKMSRLLKRQVKMYRCSATKVSQQPSLYLEFDGFANNTRSLQYLVQINHYSHAVITATIPNTELDKLRPVFNKAIGTIVLAQTN